MGSIATMPGRPSKSSQAAPKGLRAPGRALWTRLQAQYGIVDEAGLMLLETACRCWDLERSALAEVQRDGLSYLDRYGQRRPHPGLSTARDARSGYLAACRALHFDVEPTHDRVGRPGGA